MKHPKKGFTLIELLVVLAIIAIISSITFGAFRSISDGNKRTTCQSNMAQIYKSVRLYSQDFDGKYPYFNPVRIPNPNNDTTAVGATAYVADATAQPPATQTPAGGIGLWALYTFPVEGVLLSNDYPICPNNDAALPLANDGAQTGLSGYVKSAKIFHCPADRFERVVQYRPTAGGAAVASTNPVNNASISFADNTGIQRLNPAYLSYQTNDDTTAAPAVNPRMTYSSFRREETFLGVQSRVRQLTAFDVSAGATSIVDRPTDETAIITWCRFHRSFDRNDVTVTGKRNFDNVLFADGSVQSIPMQQEVIGGNCTGWQRVRRERADKVNASACP